MKKRMLFDFVLLMALFSSWEVYSQSTLLDVEIRPRTEYRDGYKSMLLTGKDAGVFTSQRTRIGLGYTSGWLNTQVTLQDASTYGQFANASSEPSTGLYEVWAELLIAPGIQLKVGRQTLKYDDNRLFSAPAWSLTGTTHDLALMKGQWNEWKWHLGYAFNNASEISTETIYSNQVKYRTMLLAWLSKELVPGLNTSLIFVSEGVQDTTGVGTRYKQWNHNQTLTYGGNLTFAFPGSAGSIAATTYFQSGKNAKGKRMDGKMAAIQMVCTAWKDWRFQIGTDYFSGDPISGDNLQTNFKKLYGSDHTFNGYMDYWNTPLNEGLLDYYFGATTLPSSVLSAEMAYHVFNTEHHLANGNRDLGSELDCLIHLKLNAQTNLQAGWCCYFKTPTTLLAKNIASGSAVKFPQWAYVMLTIKPTLLKN